MRRILGTALATGTLVLFALGGQAALANDDDVIVEKDCSGSSDLKLKLSPEHGRIEVEFEVDQNVVGDSWRVVLRHDGERFLRGIRVTEERLRLLNKTNVNNLINIFDLTDPNGEGIGTRVVVNIPL